MFNTHASFIRRWNVANTEEKDVAITRWQTIHQASLNSTGSLFEVNFAPGWLIRESQLFGPQKHG